MPASYTVRIDAPDVGFSGQCWVKDLSMSGLKLLGVPHLPTGARINLNTDNFDVTGTVRWARDQKAGIALDRNLTQEEMSILRHMRTRALRNTSNRFNVGRFTELR